MALRRPDPQAHADLLAQLGELPLEGRAWPRSTIVIVWLVMAAIAWLLLQTATRTADQPVNPLATGTILLSFAGLVVLAWAMSTSRTRITPQGIEQSWLARRNVAWQDIQYAKFVPLIASKRLICFTGLGRPVVFQAGTVELQTAFAHISLTYRRRT